MQSEDRINRLSDALLKAGVHRRKSEWILCQKCGRENKTNDKGFFLYHVNKTKTGKCEASLTNAYYQ